MDQTEDSVVATQVRRLGVTRSVRKLEPGLKPRVRTRGSGRPAGRGDVSVMDGAGDAGADCQKWAPPVEEEDSPALESPARVPGEGDARCSDGRSCEGCVRDAVRSRPVGGQGTPIWLCARTARQRHSRSGSERGSLESQYPRT